MHWPLLRARLIAYWDRKRGERIAPARREIDPLDLGRLLPHVALIDVQHNGSSFRYRLVGEHIHEETGLRLTGREVAPNCLTPDLAAACRRAAANAGIESLEAKFENAAGVVKQASLVLLPLSADGATVDGLFAGAVIRAVSPG